MEKNTGSRIADQRQQTTKFLKVEDQCEAEALFLNSGQVEADKGKNIGCHLCSEVCFTQVRVHKQ
jgi:hypothetical protein